MKRIARSIAIGMILLPGAVFENFTDFLPSALDDIEKAVRGEGILRKFPPVPQRP
mgnify:CR=1 FL=1